MTAGMGRVKGILVAVGGAEDKTSGTKALRAVADLVVLQVDDVNGALAKVAAWRPPEDALPADAPAEPAQGASHGMMAVRARRTRQGRRTWERFMRTLRVRPPRG
jgi:hypothetical protein